MKQTIRQPVGLVRAARWAQKLSERQPALRTVAVCALYGLGGLSLAGAGLLGSPLPLAACLIACAPQGYRALSALAGALVGYGLFWGLYLGLEGMAAALLVFAAMRIFAPTPYSVRLWFAPVTSAAMTAVISGVFALAEQASLLAAALLGAKVLLAAVGTVGFRRALADFDRWAMLFLTACLLMGLCAVPLPAGMTLGAVAAAVVGVYASGTAAGAAAAGLCGLALDLAAGAPGTATAGYLLAGVMCLAFHTPAGVQRSALFTVSVTAVVLFAGDADLALIPACALGAGLSLLLPGALARGSLAPERQSVPVRTRLNEAASVLETIHTFLQQTDEPPRQTDAAVIFDRTADDICRCCGGYARCWEQNAAQTYRILSAAAPKILERGMAVREDFPPEFRCCRLDGFLRTVNCEVDELRLRRLLHESVRQARGGAAEQYALMAGFLRAAAQEMTQTTARPDRFRCEVSSASAGRRGNAVSGDRCAVVHGPGHRFYVLLCDGMGTGVMAAEESLQATEVLSGLLRAGVAAADAIALLDSACALRTGAGFATIDLFEADLLSGECTLYKQGAAPSFYRKGRRVGQVGTATVPPGFAAGGDRRPGRHSLSLGGEDLLVLVTDGAADSQTAERLRAWVGTAPAELADSLLAGCMGEDDATVVVIRVRPRTSV